MEMIVVVVMMMMMMMGRTSVGVGSKNDDEYSRLDFPKDFVFGAATSAYQWEGATDEEGRTPSIWDTFAISRHDSGAGVAADGYHKYKEDVKLMAEMGLEAFRFSISWSRLIPNGRGIINPKGLRFYRNLINELTNHGIEAHVTLHHYDVPQILEDEYGGWLSYRIIEDFTAYANVCFNEFGNSVKTWTTINEPNIYAFGGYDKGDAPPGRCSWPFGNVNCSNGNSSTEPYIALHNMLLAHASVARLYKQKYKVKQGGSIGISVYTYSLVPFTNSEEDIMATQRAKDFLFGWILHPVIYGDYPQVMKEIVSTRLPSFSDNESELIKDSIDFIGIIHYTILYVKHIPLANGERDFFADISVELIGLEDSLQLKFEVKPWGMEDVLRYLKQSYGNPPVYILENGESTEHNSSLYDTLRVRYIDAYIGAVLNAIREGSNTKGYFVWSLMDLYELLGGYESGFGLYYVDFDNPCRKRSPKLSAHWYSNFLKGMNLSLYSYGYSSSH